MANITVYLKCDRNVECQEEDVFLKDAASLQCTDPQVLAKCKAIKIHHFTEGDQAQGGKSAGSGKKPWAGGAHQQRCVISVLKIIAMMEEACPGIAVQSVGTLKWEDLVQLTPRRLQRVPPQQTPPPSSCG